MRKPIEIIIKEISETECGLSLTIPKTANHGFTETEMSQIIALVSSCMIPYLLDVKTIAETNDGKLVEFKFKLFSKFFDYLTLAIEQNRSLLRMVEISNFGTYTQYK